MAERRQKYFVKLPATGGGENFVEVDLDRLSVNITQIYSRTGTSPREQNRFILDTGMTQTREAALAGRRDTANVDELAGALTDIIAQMTPDADGATSGSGHEALVELVEALEALPSVIKVLASGQTSQAQAALTEMLYAILGSVATLAAKLQEGVAAADTVDTVIGAVEGAEEATRARYAEWGLAAREVCVVANETRDLHGLAVAITTAARSAHSEAERILTLEDSDVAGMAERCQALYISAAGFLRQDRPPDQGPEVLLAEVREAVDEVGELLELAQIPWQEAHERYSTELLDKLGGGLDDLLARTRRVRGRLSKFEAEASEGAPRPDKAETLGKSFTEVTLPTSVYEAAQAALADGELAADRVSQRLGIVRDELASLLDSDACPALPGTLANDFERLTTMLPELTEKVAPVVVTEEEDAIVATHPPEAVELDGLKSESTVPPPATGSDEIDPKRLDELYELVLCVGLARTANDTSSKGLTAYSALRTLATAPLSLCTEDEAGKSSPYRGALRERLERESDNFDLPKLPPGQRKWKVPPIKRPRNTSSKHWLRYRPASNWGYFFKLTREAEAAAKALLAKHSISLELIERAAAARRDADKAERERLGKKV